MEYWSIPVRTMLSAAALACWGRAPLSTSRLAYFRWLLYSSAFGSRGLWMSYDWSTCELPARFEYHTASVHLSLSCRFLMSAFCPSVSGIMPAYPVRMFGILSAVRPTVSASRLMVVGRSLNVMSFTYITDPSGLANQTRSWRSL